MISGGRADQGFVLTTVAGLLVVVALPLAFVLLQAIFPNFGSGSLAAPFSALVEAFSDSKLLGLTLNTITLGVVVVALSSLIAIPLGVIRALFRVPLASLWDVLLLVPFMIPPYIAALAWIMTLQPRGYLFQIAGFDLGKLLFSFWGVAIVMTLNVFPAIYFAVSRTVGAIGNRLTDAARVAGATPWRAFLRVTLPLSAPGIVASLLIVFAMTIEEYGTPAALGARAGFDVLVTAIDTRVSDWPIDLSGASALSLVLVALSLSAFGLQLWLLSSRSYETVGGRSADTTRHALGAWTLPVILLFAVVTLLSTIAPLFAILATAFSRTISGGLALSNLGVDNFLAMAEGASGGVEALRNSLLLGLATALATGVLGATSAYFVVRTKLKGRQVLDALTVLPNAIPGVVVAVGLILAWNQPWWPASPYNTPLILLLAYCCILLPYPVRYANAAFRQVGESLEMAARVSGAKPIVTFTRVLLPLIAPSLIAAMLIVFAIASRELVASLLLAPVGMQTIATFIWRQFDQGSVQLGMAMSAVTIGVTTLISLAFALLSRKVDRTA
ncbi:MULTISPECIES: iron ABC transporter permease [unclassified Chelatococcus]|uniref:ABC transporter permease n=1 Tax=unclassified Chelatococcus TaxID=2638111 RepID=UPI001BCEAA0D|nr:iron ABC transporter permease [Chelatococcus sp.]MBS7739804.1 iron ABC transporter permease [Chelatococcus sp. HY11]CAH1651041.1 Ferric iron ABC transporter, permease protein [Hyphomicrobiales bacterium]MBX3545448.1 iron ABC transporter permease [Chelatococcus sp.]MCO5078897.1 iron ABC transporter permease [Chelatococcus sp.]CAH1686388.1 Ferric iron ABC transporter, permease protein [Hyphomicrobiales bacterium]